MKSIDFPQANIAIAKDQPQYQTLYGHLDFNDQQGPVTVCFQLDQDEIEAIVRTGKIWFTQITFGQAYTPVRMNTASPFPADPEGILPPMDENRTTSSDWDSTHYSPLMMVASAAAGLRPMGPCKNCRKDRQDHFYSTRQCTL